ncbi:hypothetical protein ACMTN4_01720 (plasmid) [Rhodococcus globerulus]
MKGDWHYFAVAYGMMIPSSIARVLFDNDQEYGRYVEAEHDDG